MSEWLSRLRFLKKADASPASFGLKADLDPKDQPAYMKSLRLWEKAHHDPLVRRRLITQVRRDPAYLVESWHRPKGA